MPPGTGDVGLSLGQLLPRSEAVLVTTPQPAAQRVAQRAAQMVEKLGQPLLGVIENMSSLACPCCGEATYPFGQGGGAALAAQLGVPLLGEVPLEPALREGTDTRRSGLRHRSGRRRRRARSRRSPSASRPRAPRRRSGAHLLAARRPQGLRTRPGAVPRAGDSSGPFRAPIGLMRGAERPGGDSLDERVLIDARDVAHALWDEVRGAMVEIDRPASLALVLPARSRSPARRGRPRRRQDDAREGHRPRDRRPRLAHPVHRGPDGRRA